MLVQALVNDVIRCLGLEAVVKAHLEVAMFSMVPDIIVLKMQLLYDYIILSR